MPLYVLRGLVALAFLAGCGGSSPRSSHAGTPFQPYGPARWGPANQARGPAYSGSGQAGLDRTAATFKFGRVAITDITVGLAKADGRPWDGPGGSVTDGDYQALAAALGAIDPVAAVAPILARPSVAALDKPEVKLTATLFLGTGRQDSQVARGQRDSMRPMLSPEPTWQHLPLDSSVRIQVDVIDEDFAFDDPVGTFIINGQDLQIAARKGKVYQLVVADQTGRSVLFVGLNVIPEQ